MEGSVNTSSSPPPSITDDVIPPIHTARTLVLCFDGTGDCFDAKNSNVVHFCSMLKKDDRTQQMVYYQAGIGTYTTPRIVTPGMVKILKVMDMAFAWNLDAHVMEGYEFLMQNCIHFFSYKSLPTQLNVDSAGDKISLFGFSRGAYTARALAGMVHKVGLLPPNNQQQLPFAYKMFCRTDQQGKDQSAQFKEAFSMNVNIDFIGVWDTVNSVGLIPHHLPFTASNSSIRVFRHALSLDEHRAKFRPNFYHNNPGTKAGENEKSGEKQDARHHKHKYHHTDEKKFDENEPTKTDVLEVWFAGCHTDVGGGSVTNNCDHSLARIPLRWMIRQCFLANTGILFHGKLLQKKAGLDPSSLHPNVKTRPLALAGSSTTTPASTPKMTGSLFHRLQRIGLNLSCLHPNVKPRPPALACSTTSTTPASTMKTTGTNKTLVNHRNSVSSTFKGETASVGCNDASPSSTGVPCEEDEDHRDSLCEPHDQLRCMPLWWILEVFPIRQPIHREHDNNKLVLRPVVNLGRRRKIPRQEEEVYIHRSVKMRMDAGDAITHGPFERGPYHPRAKWKECKLMWVD